MVESSLKDGKGETQVINDQRVEEVLDYDDDAQNFKDEIQSEVQLHTDEYAEVLPQTIFVEQSYGTLIAENTNTNDNRYQQNKT